MGLTKYREEGELDFGLSEGQSLPKVKGRGNQWRLEVKKDDAMRRCHNDVTQAEVFPKFFLLGRCVP
jgi:hypothetical protein